MGRPRMQARSANGSVPPACKSLRGRPTATFLNCAHMIVGVVALDQIEFHPAWHQLMALAMRDEFHSLCWTTPKLGAQVARAAVSLSLESGRERNLLPARYDVFSDPDLAPRSGPPAEFGELVMSTDYDGRPLPAAQNGAGRSAWR